MTTTIAPDVDTLEDLDFPITCQSSLCPYGHGVATHVLIALRCVCLPLPLCQPCTEHDQKVIERNWRGPAVCLRCRTWLEGFTRDWFRIEPLA